MRELESHLTRTEARPHTKFMPDGPTGGGPEAPTPPIDLAARREAVQAMRRFLEENPDTAADVRAALEAMSHRGIAPTGETTDIDNEPSGRRIGFEPPDARRGGGGGGRRPPRRTETGGGPPGDDDGDDLGLTGAELAERRDFTPEELLVQMKRIADSMEKREDKTFDEVRRKFDEYKVLKRTSDSADPAVREELRRREAEIVQDIKNHIAAASTYTIETQYFPGELLALAIEFKETREQLINRLLFRAYEDEVSEYHESMTLYAQAHLDVLMAYAQRADVKRWRELQILKSGAAQFHAMNSRLLKGDLEQFMRVAETVIFEHFDRLQDLNGVGMAMRLFEGKYMEMLSKHTRVTSEDYEHIAEEVREIFRESNNRDRGLIKSEFEKSRMGDSAGKMEDWEIDRAVNVARAFFNISFRAAEMVASGQVASPMEGGIHQQGRYSSPPMESAVRLMNWIQWLANRFNVAPPRGGLEFLRQVKNNYYDFVSTENKAADRQRKKLGKNRILEFGGMKTEEIEAAGIFGVSGIYSSWRIEEMALTRITVRLDDGRLITVKKWMEENQYELAAAKKGFRTVEEYKKAKKLQEKGKFDLAKVPYDPEAYYEALRPLIEGMDVGLGWLLKSGMLDGEVGYIARMKVWEKVAQSNLPVMMSYLSRLKFGHIEERRVREKSIKEKGKTRIKRDIKEYRGAPPAESFEKITEGWSDEQRDELRKKLSLDHEKNMKLRSLDERIYQLGHLIEEGVVGEELEKTRRALEEARGERGRIAVLDVGFTATENAAINRIKAAGMELAGDFADIMFPYLPFMNDMPFNFDYKQPGNEFYRRRNGDLARLYSAVQAYNNVMGNPGGMSLEETFKELAAIVKGIEDPHGTENAHEKIFPIFKAKIDFVEALPGGRQVIVKAISQGLRVPSSVAQEYAGMEAEALNEFEVFKKIDEAVKIGLLPVEYANELKKKKYHGLLGLLWAIFRDYWYMPFVIGAKNLAAETPKAA